MRVVTPDKGELVFTEGTCFNEHSGLQMGIVGRPPKCWLFTGMKDLIAQLGS